MFQRLNNILREIGATFPGLRVLLVGMAISNVIAGLIVAWSLAVDFNIASSHLADDTFYTLRVSALVSLFSNLLAFIILEAVGYLMMTRKKRREAEANTAANETSDDDQ